MSGRRSWIQGNSVAGYNGTFLIASVPSTTTFTYTNPITGLAAGINGTATPTNQATVINGNTGGTTVNTNTTIVLDS